jgi:very-short-patch-repair endonuclease
MAMAVQQGLGSPEALLLEARRVNRHKRRTLILEVADDIVDGARALGELDFSRLCREWRLPEPSRQAVRQGSRGRVYLDVYWADFALVVEVEGAHHDSPANAIDDSLRQNALTMGRDRVLRIPVLGLRTTPELFMAQVEQALLAAGWSRVA